MSKSFRDLLVQSACEVFETMSFLDVVPAPPLDGNVEVTGVDITATVCLAGEISGLLALHTSAQFARECFEAISGGLPDPGQNEIRFPNGEVRYL